MKHLVLVCFWVLLGLGSLSAQQGSKKDLSVYPNPTTEYIAIQDNNDAVGYLAIYSAVGRKLKEFEFTKGEHYSIGDLAKGIYLVQILDRNRQLLTTQKVEKR